MLWPSLGRCGQLSAAVWAIVGFGFGVVGRNKVFGVCGPALFGEMWLLLGKPDLDCQQKGRKCSR